MSRFEEETTVSSHYRKMFNQYPFVAIGLAAGGLVLFGRIGYYMKYGSKFKGEMYFLQTRIYTQVTIVTCFALPTFYGMGVWVSRKIRGLPTEKERPPLPDHIEYVD